MHHTPSSVSYPLNIDKYLKQPYFNTEISATCSVVNTTSYLPSLAAIELLSKLMITVNISTSFNFYCHFLKTCSFVSYFFVFWHRICWVCLFVCLHAVFSFTSSICWSCREVLGLFLFSLVEIRKVCSGSRSSGHQMLGSSQKICRSNVKKGKRCLEFPNNITHLFVFLC